MSAIVMTGAIAASAATNASSTAAAGRAPIHAATAWSTSSRRSIRPSLVCSPTSWPSPTSSITRRATGSDDVLTATHLSSAVRYVPRGTLYGMPDPNRGCW